ncbi:hypothetical protein V3C99_016847 [Haemonchus contortus]
MVECATTVQKTAESRNLSPENLDKLLSKRTETQELLSLLENQLYTFEGELLKNSFYGSILTGWNRDALSMVPSRAPQSALKRTFQDDERILSRSSVEFMKRKRRESVDQENRSHANSGKSQKTNTCVNKGKSGESNKRVPPIVIKAKPLSTSSDDKRNKQR